MLLNLRLPSQAFIIFFYIRLNMGFATVTIFLLQVNFVMNNWMYFAIHLISLAYAFHKETNYCLSQIISIEFDFYVREH